ncbi:hypothetical protein SAMN04515665_11114 [Blastococcus sp. DSM 46786]|uniref:hypothetical protein n=1 Tax=Blastococcus sp. DSM 46786 TaxID=1798227 RepID=UPI0008D88C2A|nr:hypothetical protein [Blastococcus sp. DSM 46786]SEL31262.1 hypothetical protein SAMN04515665_11114 [Blastococcus sp. DSM 46786]
MPGELLAVLAPVLGCGALIAVVVVLGASSTARYEFERNAVQAQQRAAVRAAQPTGPPRASGDVPAAEAGRSDVERPVVERSAVGLATHPRGPRLPAGPSATGWWLVAEHDGAAVAGPFADAIDAGWARLSADLTDTTRVVHGGRRPDGGVVRRQAPEEREWLADLGDQLDRLPEDWDPFMVDDEDVLTTLAVDVTAALLEAGLPLHHCEGREGAGHAAGGVCLTPHPDGAGVLVTWRQHDRMSVYQARGGALEIAVQRTMTAAVATVLGQMGFGVVEFGSPGCHLVTAAGR